MGVDEWPAELRPQAGERTQPDGKPIRSNAAWRKLAEQALGQRDAARASAQVDRSRAQQACAQVESARAEAREMAHKCDVATESALLFGAEADELRAVLAPLAAILAGLPLAVLASAGEAGRLAELYLRAELLTAEEPAERYARLQRRLAGDPETESAE